MSRSSEVVRIETYARLKPGASEGDVDHALERTNVHTNLARDGGAMEYRIETVDVPEKSGAIQRDVLKVTIPPDVDPGIVHYNNDQAEANFEFNQVFDINATQEDVFEEVVATKVMQVLAGVNCTVFAYGQTGSGKTFTVSGGDSFQDRGLIPRTVALVYSELARRRKFKPFVSKCQISFTEVYNEVIYDLLDQDQRALPLEKRSPVQVMESVDGLVLRNLNVFEVANEEDALGLFFMGTNSRQVDSTSMNQASSRSHAIFTILINSEGMVQEHDKQSFENDLVVSGKINLVDLAGSERMYKMKNNKEQLREAKSINLSLHFLEQVIINLRSSAGGGGADNTLRQQQADDKHVPYRNSVLTNVLRDSLGGNCQSCFILTMSTDRLHFEETISTCRFGQRCGEVKVSVGASVEVSLGDQLKERVRYIEALEREREEEKEAAAKALKELHREVDRYKSLYHNEALSAQRLHDEQVQQSTRLRLLESQAHASAAEVTETDYELIRQGVESMLQATHRVVELHKTQQEQEQDTCLELELAARRPLGPLVERFGRKGTVALVDSLAETSQRLFIEHQLLQVAHEKAVISRGVRTSDEKRSSLVTGLEGESWLQGLQRGAYFLKVDRYYRRSIRFVCVTTDKRSLYWRKVSGPRPPTLLRLAGLQRVHWTPGARGEGIVNLVGREGMRSVRLIIPNTHDAVSSEEAHALARSWSKGLSRLVGEENNEKTGGTDSYVAGEAVEEQEEAAREDDEPADAREPLPGSLFRVNLSPVDRDTLRSPAGSFTPKTSTFTPRVLPAATPRKVDFLRLEAENDDSSYVSDDDL